MVFDTSELELEINKLFADLKDTVSSPQLLESAKYSAQNAGKRIRPILSLITAEAVMHKKENGYHTLKLQDNPALGLALAIELVHCGSLIHDDLPCMDDDDLRRGKPSNHKKYGETTALLAGDFLMTYPIKIFISKTQEFFEKQGPDQDQLKYQKLINLSTEKLVQAITKMIIGQSLDMEYCSSKSQATIEQINHMQKLKTGALLEASIEISAVLAGANKHQIIALKQFAENLGLAFQITDDILDCISSTEALGKTKGKDTEQNKFTYVKHYGLDQARKIAQNLIIAAKTQIETIGVYPAKLSHVADYVILRTN